MSSDTDSVLRSPVASSSSLASDDGTTQVVESGPAEETSDNHDTTSNAGSATPTKASHTVSTPKKSRAFFGLAPLSGFLRARNSPSTKAEPQVGQSEDSVEAVVTGGPSTNGGDPYDDEGSPIPGDEEDDRKTIRPDTEEESSVEDKEIVEPSPNGAPHTNGLTPPAAAAHVEKPFGSGIEAAETVPLASERVS